MTDLPLLPPRPPESHKGNFGLALVVGGSCGMAGAAALAGKSALRGGAGLVRLAVPAGSLDVIAAHDPCYMTVPLPEDRRGRISLAAHVALLRSVQTATVVAIGPGLGRSLGLDTLVGRLYRELAQPLVVDADALNALAARPESLQRPGGARILTPHPGEFDRLAGGAKLPAEERERRAVELALRCHAVVVLKGHRTLVTDGAAAWRNDTGNPGMATGGSGDVLTGLLAALACQGLAPYDAARLAVHLHGLAGDLAAAALSQESMTAADLVEHLPAAFREYRTRNLGPSQ